MFKKIKTLILSHKIISGIVLLVLVALFSFIFIKSSANSEARYITENVIKDNIIISATGTGQVEASNTITLKSKTTGDITYVGVKVGDIVKRGKLIVSVDSRDAKIALLNAQLSLEKLITPDSLTLLQKQNSLTKSFSDGWNTVTAYISDTDIMLDEIYNIYNNDGYLGYSNAGKLGKIGKEKVSLAEASYYDAEDSLFEVKKLYETLSRTSSKEEIKSLIEKTYESARFIDNTVKITESAFSYTVNYLDDGNDSLALSTKTSISSWLNDSNNYVSSLLSVINSVEEGEQSLDELTLESDDLDVRSAELTLQSKQYAYNDCFIYAPFDGIIATLTAKVGESSGSSVGTLITNQKIATIPFNEIDIASIKLNQNVNLTFDSIEGLSVLGTVLEIDPVGTVSSGVVTYNVKVNFDSKDERIRPGMSVNAEIITEEKKDILTISSSAIKTRDGKSYVEVFENPVIGGNNPMGVTSLVKIIRKPIEIGISDDAITEIISGLSLGDQIISKIVTNSSKTSSIKSTSASAGTPSILNTVGGRMPMGGGGR